MIIKKNTWQWRAVYTYLYSLLSFVNAQREETHPSEGADRLKTGNDRVTSRNQTAGHTNCVSPRVRQWAGRKHWAWLKNIKKQNPNPHLTCLLIKTCTGLSGKADWAFKQATLCPLSFLFCTKTHTDTGKKGSEGTRDGIHGHREGKVLLKKRSHRFNSFSSRKNGISYHVHKQQKAKGICTEMLTTILPCETRGDFCLSCFFLYVPKFLPRILCISIMIKERKFLLF